MLFPEGLILQTVATLALPQVARKMANFSYCQLLSTAFTKIPISQDQRYKKP
jgi:hypothetical protein